MELSVLISIFITIFLTFIGAFKWIIRVGERSNENKADIEEIKEEMKELKHKHNERDIQWQKLDKTLAVIETKVDVTEERIKGIFKEINELNNKLDRDFVRKDK